MTPTPVIWPTPTPWPTPAEAPLFTLGSAGDITKGFAEQAVATYNMANTNGFLDGLYAVLLLLITFFILRYLIKQVRNL